MTHGISGFRKNFVIWCLLNSLLSFWNLHLLLNLIADMLKQESPDPQSKKHERKPWTKCSLRQPKDKYFLYEMFWQVDHSFIEEPWLLWMLFLLFESLIREIQTLSWQQSCLIIRNVGYPANWVWFGQILEYNLFQYCFFGIFFININNCFENNKKI